MSKASRGLVASADNSKVGPDYFGYYTHEIVELLSQDEDFSPFTSETPEHICNGAGSFFNNGLGAGLSDFKKERLKVLLRQAVLDLTPEVDEMLDPVVAMLELRSQLRSKGTGSDGDAGQVPQKKFKMSSSSSSTSIPSHASPVNCKSSREGSESKHINSKFSDVALSEKRISNVVRKNCAHCHTTKTPQWRIGPDGNTSLCNACGINYRKGRNVQSGSKIRADNENEEVDDDLQFLLENDSLQVEETMKKYSDELSETLGRMEQQLEELLDAVVSKCRPMTQTEKQQLRKLIQNLPPKNLDRVVQIFRRSKPVETQTLAEFFVDLEKEDNVTLWRLYYYVEAVEKARNLSL